MIEIGGFENWKNQSQEWDPRFHKFKILKFNISKKKKEKKVRARTESFSFEIKNQTKLVWMVFYKMSHDLKCEKINFLGENSKP
jgi:hypothetical protein